MYTVFTVQIINVAFSIYFRCYPFVLYYTKLDHLRLVMNFGAYGNDARFIRKSCSPTAEVCFTIHQKYMAACTTFYRNPLHPENISTLTDVILKLVRRKWLHAKFMLTSHVKQPLF